MKSKNRQFFLHLEWILVKKLLVESIFEEGYYFWHKLELSRAVIFLKLECNGVIFLSKHFENLRRVLHLANDFPDLLHCNFQ